MSKRKTIQERESLGDALEGSLGHVRAVVQQYIDKFGESAKLVHDVEYDYDSEYHYWHIEYERQETDAELSKRLERARKERERKAAKAAELEERERKELARLKAKYSEEK